MVLRIVGVTYIVALLIGTFSTAYVSSKVDEAERKMSNEAKNPFKI